MSVQDPRDTPKRSTQRRSGKPSADVSFIISIDDAQKTPKVETTIAHVAGLAQVTGVATDEAHVARAIASPPPCRPEVLPGYSKRNKPPFFFSNNLTLFFE